MEILIGDLREGVLDIWDRSKKKSAEARQAYADEKVPPPKDGHGRNLTGPLLKEIFDTKLTKGLDEAYKKGWLKKGKTRAYHDNSGPNKSQRMTGKPAKSLTTCPNSPDLNVIEDLWNMLSMRCVRARGSVSPLSSNSSLSLFALLPRRVQDQMRFLNGKERTVTSLVQAIEDAFFCKPKDANRPWGIEEKPWQPILTKMWESFGDRLDAVINNDGRPQSEHVSRAAKRKADEDDEALLDLTATPPRKRRLLMGAPCHDGKQKVCAGWVKNSKAMLASKNPEMLQSMNRPAKLKVVAMHLEEVDNAAAHALWNRIRNPAFGATPSKTKGWDHGAFDKLLHQTYKKKIDGLVKRAD